MRLSIGLILPRRKIMLNSALAVRSEVDAEGLIFAWLQSIDLRRPTNGRPRGRALCRKELLVPEYHTPDDPAMDKSPPDHFGFPLAWFSHPRIVFHGCKRQFFSFPEKGRR